MGLKLRQPARQLITGGRISQRQRRTHAYKVLMVVGLLFVGFVTNMIMPNSDTSAALNDWYTAGWDKISVGSAPNACGISLNTVYCWGVILGSSTREFTVPTNIDTGGVFTGKTITDISTAYDHSCAVADGAVYCWGWGANGQLGDGNLSNSNTPVAVDTTGVLSGKTITSVSTNNHNSCVIAEGSVYCWGDNSMGEIGDGTTTMRPTPVAIDTAGILSGKTVTKLSMGIGGGCVIASGEPYCWNQRPGNGRSYGAGPYPIVAVDTSGALNGKTLTDIDAGVGSCALADGKVYCWGFDSEGALGAGGSGTQDTPIAVDTTGVLAGKTVTALSHGDNIGHCSLAAGKAYCWGFNANAELGDGTQTNRNTPVAVDDSGVLSGKSIDSIVSSQRIGCVLSAGKAYCWGSQAYLGNGTTTGSLVAVEVKPPAPTIASLSNTTAPINTSDQTTIINGTNFDTSGASVFIGGVSADVTNRTNSQLTVTIPSSSTSGLVDVEVVNPDGQSAVKTNGFEYVVQPPPSISSMSGTQGTMNGGEFINIVGSNFDNPTVRVGENTAQIRYSDSTYIQAIAPPSSISGLVDVTVINQNGTQSTRSNAFEYIRTTILPNRFKRAFGEGGTGNGQFDWLEGVTTDRNGNVYVTDNGNSRVQVFDKNGNYLRQFGTAGSGDGQFDYPTAIKIGPDGNVYVLDTNNYRVEVFTKSGAYIRQIDVSEAGYSEGMAINSQGDIYITDCDTHSSVRIYAQNGSYLRALGEDGSGDGQFDCSYAVTIDKNDNVYIADASNYRVQVFNKDDNFIRKIGTQGIGEGQLGWVEDLVVDKYGNLLVVDAGNNRIQVFTKSGDYLGQIGSFGNASGQLDWPNSIAIGQNGDLYIMDADNYRIEVFEGMPTASTGNNGGNGTTNPGSSFTQGDATTDMTSNSAASDDNGDKTQKHKADKDTKKDEVKNDDHGNNSSMDRSNSSEEPKTFIQKVADFVAKHPVAAIATAAATVVVSSSAIWWLIVLLKP